MAGRCAWVAVDLSSYLASSEPMADKADKKQKQPAPPLLVQAGKMIKKALPSPAVQWVSLWALFTAGVFAVSGVLAYSMDIPCSESSWLFPCIELTDAGEARAVATFVGTHWCTAAQAAAALAALLFPARRGRRALAYVALAAAAANHYMYASLAGVLLDADPGYLFLWIGGTAAVSIFAAGDLAGFLALLLGEDDK
ncbi:unnamed protein product [Urochloa decumbens]|uniref:Uncharacterized protein n=1 Tax=Urochloa decumbens TaxID=240449 RepID=A0ABC8ZP01_9POAL